MLKAGSEFIDFCNGPAYLLFFFFSALMAAWAAANLAMGTRNGLQLT